MYNAGNVSLHRASLRTVWEIMTKATKAAAGERKRERWRYEEEPGKEGGGYCARGGGVEGLELIYLRSPPGHFHILKCAPSHSISPEPSCVQGRRACDHGRSDAM